MKVLLTGANGYIGKRLLPLLLEAGHGLRRLVIPVPVLSPRLSSYWLYLVTSTSFPLARNLVDSMTVDVVCRDDRIRSLIPRDLLTYEEAVRLAFGRIEGGTVASSWIDALGTRGGKPLDALVQIPPVTASTGTTARCRSTPTART